MDIDEYIEFYLCDKCMESNAKKIRRALVGVRYENMDEYFAKCKDIGEQYRKFNEFRKAVCGDASLSMMEDRVLWFLQGLKNGFEVKYNVLGKLEGFTSFGIPAIKVGIMVCGGRREMLEQTDMTQKLAEVEYITNIMHKDGWRIMTLLPNDMFLRNKGLGRCFKSLREPIRNRIIDIVGPSNYEKLPGLEPDEDD